MDTGMHVGIDVRTGFAHGWAGTVDASAAQGEPQVAKNRSTVYITAAGMSSNHPLSNVKRRFS